MRSHEGAISDLNNERIHGDDNGDKETENENKNMLEDNDNGNTSISKNDLVSNKNNEVESMTIDENNNDDDVNNELVILERNLRPKRKKEFAKEASSKRPQILRNKVINEERKREGKLEILIEELNDSKNDVPVLEENETLNNGKLVNNIDKLTRQFLRIEVEKAKRIQEWYEYGQNFIKEYKSIAATEECSEQMAKRDLRVIMVEMANEIIISGHKNVTIDAVRDSTKRAMKVAKLFDEIGSDKIWHIRKTSPRFITELKENEREQIVSYFRNNV